MADKLTDAEAKLADLQKHIHAAEAANFKMHRAERLMHEHGDDPKVSAAHRSEFEQFAKQKTDAEKAHAASGVTARDIDIAAQAVLDERGESHTETNILPGAE